jgi:hypothetical protein
MSINLQDFIKEQIKARPIEAKITRKVVRALKAAGTPVVKTWDGYESEKVETMQDVLEQAFNLDEVYLYTADGSWVRLVMGNEYDLICDYTTDLEDALQPVNDWIEKNQD